MNLYDEIEKIKASGYKTKTLDLDVKADQAISTKLEK